MQDPSLYQQISPQFPEHEQSNCPRCDSKNTKFCYYNNYNLSQPRHYCKNCRRYWTKGGTIRNIPIGGGIRKNTKRSNSSSKQSSKSEPSDGFRSVDQDRRMIHTENDQIRSLIEGINSNGLGKNPIFSSDLGLEPGFIRNPEVEFMEMHSGDKTQGFLGVDENGGNSSHRMSGN